ncbi:hypothetical protein FISHEDRAFT_56645 [Fistulina hepatica ATCC 64428]|uniref:Alpha-type protein kinase domain-containing protein n=1 Tax=Fistulina hepatica ATCC 64428 TaxID=1128425 RepID=A0A0D7AID3_9AGAR|nr:hypothetical protein FISHEDRAFT_56645 [Fistulina hepatica ATCC 64428]
MPQSDSNLTSICNDDDHNGCGDDFLYKRDIGLCAKCIEIHRAEQQNDEIRLARALALKQCSLCGAAFKNLSSENCLPDGRQTCVRCLRTYYEDNPTLHKPNELANREVDIIVQRKALSNNLLAKKAASTAHHDALHRLDSSVNGARASARGDPAAFNGLPSTQSSAAFGIDAFSTPRTIVGGTDVEFGALSSSGSAAAAVTHHHVKPSLVLNTSTLLSSRAAMFLPPTPDCKHSVFCNFCIATKTKSEPTFDVFHKRFNGSTLMRTVIVEALQHFSIPFGKYVSTPLQYDNAVSFLFPPIKNPTSGKTRHPPLANSLHGDLASFIEMHRNAPDFHLYVPVGRNGKVDPKEQYTLRLDCVLNSFMYEDQHGPLPVILGGLTKTSKSKHSASSSLQASSSMPPSKRVCSDSIRSSLLRNPTSQLAQRFRGARATSTKPPPLSRVPVQPITLRLYSEVHGRISDLAYGQPFKLDRSKYMAIQGMIATMPEATGTGKSKIAFQFWANDGRKFIMKRVVNTGSQSGVVSLQENEREVELEFSRLLWTASIFLDFMTVVRSCGAPVDNSFEVNQCFVGTELITGAAMPPSDASGVSMAAYTQAMIDSPGGTVAWLVEPYRTGCEHKWCGTLGFQFPDNLPGNTMSAFAHYVFLATQGQLVVSDLQSLEGLQDGSPDRAAGIFERRVIKYLFDPMLHSSRGYCGLGDFGQEGLDNFLQNHRCKIFCQSLSFSESHAQLLERLQSYSLDPCGEDSDEDSAATSMADEHPAPGDAFGELIKLNKKGKAHAEMSENPEASGSKAASGSNEPDGDDDSEEPKDNVDQRNDNTDSPDSSE